jgi:hypothetical protein
MKYLILIFISLITQNSFAQAALSLAIPGAPGSYQSDRFRSGELDCSMAIGSGTNVEFGVVGVITNTQTITANTIPNTKDVGVYGRISIPIGAPKGRVDCNILYQLELDKKRIEIQKLQSELNNLKALKFEK